VFSGFEYNKEFEEACEELATERDPQQVRRRLMSVEWVLWEAIRGVFLQISSMVAALIVLPLLYLISPRNSWVTGIGVILSFLVLSTSVYWVCRAVFHYEISRHVRPRTFGEPGFKL
jgi:hypothetical protein